ncbi:uncharacterized protein TNCV_2765821 [Trichonephila clavipes]|nr:uncharacterized protein TNCV_2765821 [Trichonephila clavipes]
MFSLKILCTNVRLNQRALKVITSHRFLYFNIHEKEINEENKIKIVFIKHSGEKYELKGNEGWCLVELVQNNNLKKEFQDYVRENEMHTNEEYCEMALLYGQYNRNKREAARLYVPLNFPVEDIHLIIQLPLLFNACIKPGVVIDVFPYLVPHLQRIPAEDVLGYALAHPESSVRDINKACCYSKSMVWNILRTYGVYPYRLALAQELMPGDQDHRFDFCNFG